MQQALGFWRRVVTQNETRALAKAEDVSVGSSSVRQTKLLVKLHHSSLSCLKTAARSEHSVYTHTLHTVTLQSFVQAAAWPEQ